jgi:predicted double-glycine peptidase
VAVLLAATNPWFVVSNLAECAPDIASKWADADNVVHQTTGYTCGAAACATLLRRLGIAPAATEKEMVPLCLTRRWGGASTLGIAVGLKSKAAPQGWRVRIMQPDWETFLRLRKPLLCSVTVQQNTGHAVVVCEIREGSIQVADPLEGLVWRMEEEFKMRFKNEAIAVFRNDPFEKDEQR